jgi:hypothetical protein
MKLDPTALISLLAGILPVGAVTAFFLYVSPLTILAVVAILMAVMLMFSVGVMWGRQLGLEGSVEDQPQALEQKVDPWTPPVRRPAGPTLL